ncbi:MAG: DoxX family protein [Chloroflexi bacterium]|nr:MAG: DoxX family protein [Chloroflexota bacterium]
MNTALWIVQILLAVMFLMTGMMKGFMPLEKIGERMAFVNDAPSWMPRLAGYSEVLGAIGLVFPMLFNIAPVLTPLAAIGLAIVMVLAAILHFRRKEYPMIAMNAVLFALAVFVAYGRLVAAPVA